MKWKRAVAIIAPLVLLAALGAIFVGAAGTHAPTQERVGSPTPAASPVPVLDCPTPPASASKLRVIGQFVRLREEPKSLANGVGVRGKIPFGEVVELRDIRGGNWRKVACGQIEGWVLMHNGLSGADRRFRLEPVS
jgi:hypothetical protein